MSTFNWCRRFVLSLCVSVALAGCAGGGMQRAPVQVVLLGGQSNMVGAGDYDEIDEQTRARIEAVSERVFYSLDPGPVRQLTYTPNKPSEKYQFTKRFGPEIMIGVTLAEAYPDKEFLLVKTAQGGTALYGAWNPDWSAEKAEEVENTELKRTTPFYAKHIAHTKKALAYLKQAGKAYEVVGVAWMQGENDAAKEVSSRSYAANLKNLISSYRRDMEAPEMVFVAGQINSHYGRFAEGPEMVRGAMLEVEAQDKNIAIVRTRADAPWTDFPKHDDQVHYNTQGQLNLGTALGEKLVALLNAQ